jgi:hypothetical protein
MRVMITRAVLAVARGGALLVTGHDADVNRSRQRRYLPYQARTFFQPSTLVHQNRLGEERFVCHPGMLDSGPV